MTNYAQTIHALIQQLSSDGWSCTHLTEIKIAHDAAVELFAGRMQSHGKPLLCHCAGVASVLALHDTPPALVAAGLLHNVYYAGDFADAHSGATTRRRREMQKRVGPDVEAYLFAFAGLDWKTARLPKICSTIRSDDILQRHALLLKLADLCEDLSSYGMLYRPNGAELLTGLAENDALLREIARRIGFEQIGLKLSELIREAGSAQFVGRLAAQGGPRFGTVVAPKSYRKRFSLRVLERLRRSSDRNHSRGIRSN